METDHCVYRNKGCNLSDRTARNVIIALYVDDGLILSSGRSLIEEVLTHLRGAFEVTVGDATSYVGMQIAIRDSGITLHQSGYIARKAELLWLPEPTRVSTPLNPSVKYCKSGVVSGKAEDETRAPYRQLIEAMLYVSNGSRPDVAYAMCSLSRFNSCPKESHWEGAKRVIRYLKNTQPKWITHTQNEAGLYLDGYSDAYHGGDRDDRESVSGSILLINGSPVIWKSPKQSKVAGSTAVVEFVAVAHDKRDSLGAQLLKRSGREPEAATPLLLDNQTAICLISNNQIHAKTKALDLDLLFVRDLHEAEISVSYVSTEDQFADFLTKQVEPGQFLSLMKRAVIK